MVEMQMRIEDNVDVLGIKPSMTNSILKPSRVTSVRHTVYIGELCTVLVADTRID
jgi:hypothetical protein